MKYSRLKRSMCLFMAMTLIVLNGCDYIMEVASNTRKKEVSLPSNDEIDSIVEKMSAEKEKATKETADNDQNNSETDLISVSLSGYDTKGAKFFVLGEPNNSTEFSVADSGNNIVYNGRIKEGIGDFSDIDKEGEYRIVVKDLGQSVSFRVMDNYYLKEYKQYEEAKERSASLPITRDCFTDRLIEVADISMTYFTFYKDDDNKYYEDKLSMAREIMDKYSEFQRDDGGFDSKIISNPESEGFLYAGAAAMLAECFMDKDDSYFAELSDRAERAYKYNNDFVQDMESEEFNDEKYFASAALYNLGGDNGYRKVVEDIMLSNDLYKGFYAGECGYYGTLLYLKSTRKVNRELSQKAIDSLLLNAIEIAKEAPKDRYLVYTDGVYSELAKTEVLSDIKLLLLANSISKSTIYVESAENHYAFLCGRNEDNRNYLLEADKEADASEEKEYNDKLSLEFVYNGFINSYFYE